MRELPISYGYSRSAKTWRNGLIAWDELCYKLQHTTRTPETVEEYRAMTSEQRNAAKDNGCFVGGHLRNGNRTKGNVLLRSMLTLDADDADPGFIEHFAENCRFAAALYTTHSHTPEAPRIRIVIPLEQDITPDCYAAVTRLFAAQWGIDQFDTCSYKVNQPMYWPTTPKDGEYVCRIVTGPFFNAMDFLAAYPDWHDCSTLPCSSRETQLRSLEGKKQEDPLTKRGYVGAFCRTYTIQDAIEKFLSDVYAPSVVEGRYDYIPGEGTAGVAVYDDKFAYSHHATDPACCRLLNAFDLVRIHRFGDDNPKESFLQMEALAKQDELVVETLERERVAEARADFAQADADAGAGPVLGVGSVPGAGPVPGAVPGTLTSTAVPGSVTGSVPGALTSGALTSGAPIIWDEPLPFEKHTLMPFPTDVLPPDIRRYVEALSESAQTPVDMAGSAALCVIATSIQGKYMIQGKGDWLEPLNLYLAEIALPSERKSAIQHAMVRPVSDYENDFNKANAAAVEASRMQKRVLERRQKAMEEQNAKNKASREDIEKIAAEVTAYVVQKPLRLFVDDITPEKLVSVLAENNGRMAILSSEAGIFDTLAGVYSRTVNIDVILKSYSGDQIRVDRIGRESESIIRPALTILLMAQPSVIATVLNNKTFRSRGLTARFLYTMPVSLVGKRQFSSAPVQPDVYTSYARCISDLLKEEYADSPAIITLCPEAATLLEDFAEELEPRLTTIYADISDWCGKLVGNTLRIAGLLCRASTSLCSDFLDGEKHQEEEKHLVVDAQTMRNAIRLGRYFLNHAQVIFNVLPEDNMYKDAQRILKMIHERGLTEFNRRTAMRNCRHFKRSEDIQPVLDFLEDYGYIARKESPPFFGKGRPPMPAYLVNPHFEEYFCPSVTPAVTISDNGT